MLKDCYEPAAKSNELGCDGYILQRYTSIQEKRAPLGYAPLDDVRNVIRTVRAAHPTSVLGLWGFSAGGHLASMLHHDVDFTILSYPITTMDVDIAHRESRLILLGLSPSPAEVSEMSADRHINGDTGPFCIFHTAEDEKVVVEHSLRLARALSKSNRPVKLIIAPRGLHGIPRFDDQPGIPEFLHDISQKDKLVVFGELDFGQIERLMKEEKLIMVQNYEVAYSASD